MYVKVFIKAKVRANENSIKNANNCNAQPLTLDGKISKIKSYKKKIEKNIFLKFL